MGQGNTGSTGLELAFVKCRRKGVSNHRCDVEGVEETSATTRSTLRSTGTASRQIELNLPGTLHYCPMQRQWHQFEILLASERGQIWLITYFVLLPN